MNDYSFMIARRIIFSCFLHGQRKRHVTVAGNMRRGLEWIAHRQFLFPSNRHDVHTARGQLDTFFSFNGNRRHLLHLHHITVHCGFIRFHCFGNVGANACQFVGPG